jgi:hypothetical protein
VGEQVLAIRPAELATRAPGPGEARFCGHGSLLQDRADFDAWSQLLIDNLPAL